jgi:oligosaccharide repeat unit polymerase
VFKNFAILNLLSGFFGVLIVILYLISLNSSQIVNVLLTPFIVFACLAYSIVWCLPPSQITSNKFDPFHPGSLFFIFYLFYIIFSGLIVWLINDYSSMWVDLGFNYASLVNKAFILATLGCAFFGLGLRAPININHGTSIKNLFYSYKIFRYKDFKIITGALFIVGLLASLQILNLYSSTGDNVFIFLSPSARRDAELPISQLDVMLTYCLIWAAIFLCIISFYKKRRFFYILAIILMFIIIFLVSAKRSTILPIILIPIIYYHYRINWLNILKAIRWASTGVLVIISFLLLRIVLPAFINDVDIAQDIGEDFFTVAKFYLNSGEWMTFDMFLLSLEKSDELNHFIGGASYGFLYFTFATMVIIIPRAIWPDKPIFEDLGQKYFQYIENSSEPVGYAVTVWGASFQFFNILGLTLGFFILGWALKYIYYWIKPYNGYRSDILIYGIFFWMLFLFLRFGTMGFTIVVFVQTMLVGVLSIFFISRNIIK